MDRIHSLDTQLTNQIAAGEVVERPASVVKELVENCIDAGARRVEVDIERGGARLIRILDDGRGIHKDDLALALTRHATSKIKSFNDLCAVKSLGFRGEALASIASVSRLLLRSRQADAELGWQAVAEGRDMAVKVTPAAAVTGTCIEVRDLFYNTPARRKFLRTEKTEFTHIEDTVKREALANPEVAFVLKHNGKIIKRYPAAKSFEHLQEKLKLVCGRGFSQQALYFHSDLDELSIKGWLGSPQHHRSESDNQFIFINGRPVRDRLLSHAIRQSYTGRIPQGRFASYAIYIQCPANEVDVNVHPTKHEVRFRNPRQIHDFLVKLIEECLSGSTSMLDNTSMNSTTSFEQQSAQSGSQSYSDGQAQFDSGQSNSGKTYSGQAFSRQVYAHSKDGYSASENRQRIAEQHNAYQQMSKVSEQVSEQSSVNKNSQSFNLNQTLWKQRYWVLPESETISIVDAWAWYLNWMASRWLLNGLSKPLLIPQMVTVKHSEDFENPALFDAFKQAGIELTPAGATQVMVRQLPLLMADTSTTEQAFPLPAVHWLTALQSLLQQRLPFSEKQMPSNASVQTSPTRNTHSVADESAATSTEVEYRANQLKQQVLKHLQSLDHTETSSKEDRHWLQNWAQYQVAEGADWRPFAFSISESSLLSKLGQVH